MNQIVHVTNVVEKVNIYLYEPGIVESIGHRMYKVRVLSDPRRSAGLGSHKQGQRGKLPMSVKIGYLPYFIFEIE